MSSETETHAITSPSHSAQGGTSADRTLPPARVPRSSARAGWLGVVLAVVVLGLGVLAAYDATTLLGWTDGDPVGTPVVDSEVGVRPDTATTVLGAVLALLGLWLLWSGVKRGPRRGVRLATATGAWMSHGDLERLVTGTGEDVHGVISARSSVSRRRVRVSARTTSPEVRESVRAAVTERLSALADPPRVTVLGSAQHDDGGEGR